MLREVEHGSPGDRYNLEEFNYRHIGTEKRIEPHLHTWPSVTTGTQEFAFAENIDVEYIYIAFAANTKVFKALAGFPGRDREQQKEKAPICPDQLRKEISVTY